MLIDSHSLLKSLNYPKLHGNSSLDEYNISTVSCDSRNVNENTLFICIIGNTVDGHDFVNSAIEKGASIIVHQTDLPTYDNNITYIQVKDTNRALASIANLFYSTPSNTMSMIGVTGTNGKTTTTNIIEHVLSNAKISTGIIGTIETRYNGIRIPSANTTPNALDLQKILADMRDAQVKAVAMEVSSHALILGRTWGTHFDTAVFTNLTQDHLDFHKDMDDYASAKSLLFSRLSTSANAVINIDDSYAEYFLQRTQSKITTYGIDNDADYRATNIELSPKGTKFDLVLPNGETKHVSIKLIGKFNIYNVLAAISVGQIYGLSIEDIMTSINEIKGIDGRFESVEAGQEFSVIVDYAHTPDSLENVLKTARELTNGRVITVVGCGGDRDKTKRPIMAKIAQDYADFTVITSDNPRTEDPHAILTDMEVGLNQTLSNYKIVEDRSEGIAFAINGIDQLTKNDTVIIAGKGHETYQIIGREKTHFDDREHAANAIHQLTH